MTARVPFPKSLPEFMSAFPDERAAFEYVVASRWPDGFACPKCGGREASLYAARGLFVCRSCKSQTSPTAGTALHRSKIGLQKWLLAAWLLVTDKRGISATQLSTQLSLRLETAFQMLHKLRAGMVAPERTKLSGAVQVDETFIGAESRAARRRTIADKLVVAGAVEILEAESPTTGKVSVRPGRIRLRHVGGRTSRELLAFVTENVAKGSRVVTDGLKEYGSLADLGYLHEIESTAYGDEQDDVLPHLHTVFSNLKAYLAGTYHGAVSEKHLQAYLNEFAFRYNRRRNPQAAFQTLLGIASRVRGPEYEDLYAGEWVHPNPRRSR